MSKEPKPKNEKKERKFRKPNPLATLLLLIMTVICTQLFVPNKWNPYDWIGILWNVFWWLWVFPFLFIKVYDWYTVRKRRNTPGGVGTSPWIRMLGIMILAILFTLMFLFLIFYIIVPLLLGGIGGVR